VADLCGAAALDQVADRIAAARASDQGDARCPGARQHAVDGSLELAPLILRRRAAGLRDGIVGARQRIGEVEGMEAIGRITIRLEAPQGRDPEGGMIAVAVDEDDRGHGLGEGGRD
jgi:hypothetical protein